ncbi:hypothetical protein [Luteibaculum oceani]|uniref:Uncharacterized protein n=1 Tax=Luteibaculum oceani TaxID=1294296 RepID=A0A5C6UU71_9FLAO|nr:hypothetical protein [Luteibaculum oceani]TXC76903.1 hypothetical protein FRX97_09815 [Luteibaculum oceani]
MAAIIEEKRKQQLVFRNPNELRGLLDEVDFIDVMELEQAWYKNVRTWSAKDIIHGKLLIADYHWKLKREDLHL